MTQISTIIRLSLGPLFSSAFLFFLNIKLYTPQAIALTAIITIVVSLKQKRLSYTALSFLVNIIIFSTGGLNSPVFYLSHFFIFCLSALYPPVITLSYSLVTTLFMVNSLDSIQSVLNLISLPLITPLAHYISKLSQDNIKKGQQIEVDQDQIVHHESNYFLWFSLTFKRIVSQIIDTTSQLLSNPKLDYGQKQKLKHIKHSTKILLKTATKLAKDIDTETDEI